MALPRLRGVLALGLLPLWILLYELVAAPRAIDRLGDIPPAVAGLPVGILLVGAALVVMAAGVVVLRRTSSTRSSVLAFLCLTLPSAVVIVVAPALILMVQMVQMARW